MKAKMFWLIVCQFLLVVYYAGAQQAVQLTSPAQDASLDITNNISFKWNAAQIPDAVEISYKVQVFEIGISPTTLVKGSLITFMNTQTPVWQAVQKKGLAASWPVPENAVGKKYLWRVITLVGGQPRSFEREMANYFYINSLTIKTDEVNKVITADKKEVTFENNNPPGRPKFPPQKKDTIPVNNIPSQTLTSYTLTLAEPFNSSVINTIDSKYPIKFVWRLTPELNKGQEITYRLHVHECIGTQTAQQAISNNPPVINKLSKRLNLVAELLPADAAGKKYAWTVEGTVTGANGQKDKVVYSDAWTFKVAKNEKEPGPKEPGSVKNKYTGPKLKYPNNGAELKAGAINNLQLSWEPVSPAAQQPLTYRWFVYEMQGGRSATDIVKNSSPVKEGTVKNIFFATLNLPADAPGKSYAWTVQAVNDEGGSYGDNDGFADPFVFNVQSGGKVTVPKDPPPSTQRSLCADVTKDAIICKGKNAQGKYVYYVKLKYSNTSNDGNKNYLNHYVVNPINGTRIPAPANGNYIEAWPVGSATINYITPDPVLSTSINTGSSISLEFELTLTGSLSYLRVLGSHYDSDNMGGDNCDDDITLTWPPCPCDYCDDKSINIVDKNERFSETNNILNYSANISIPGVKVKQLKAELIGFSYEPESKNDQCLVCNKDDRSFGNITGGTLNLWPSMTNGALGFDGSGGNTRHTIGWWGGNAVSVNNASLNLYISLPPATTLSCCNMNVNFCIRITFMDDQCRSCSIVKCVPWVRRPQQVTSSKK